MNKWSAEEDFVQAMSRLTAEMRKLRQELSHSRLRAPNHATATTLPTDEDRKLRMLLNDPSKPPDPIV